jgi:hypothetical protein
MSRLILAWNNLCVIGWLDCVSLAWIVADCDNGQHERMGRDISENGICYLVRRYADFGSCCKKGYFAVYGETTLFRLSVVGKTQVACNNHCARLAAVTFV